MNQNYFLPVIDSSFPEAQNLTKFVFKFKKLAIPASVISSQSEIFNFLRWMRVLPNSVRVSSLQQVLETSRSYKGISLQKIINTKILNLEQINNQTFPLN